MTGKAELKEREIKFVPAPMPPLPIIHHNKWNAPAPHPKMPPLSLALARARILGRADAGALLISISAAFACFLSGMGKLRPGPANVEDGSLRRCPAVNLAILILPHDVRAA